jgi:hypothetical protein
MNSTGAANQAATTSASLAALGFHMVGVGDVPSVGDLAETVVNYGSRSSAIEADAEAVARSMTGAVIMAYAPSQVADGAKVTVVTGTQFIVKAPTSSSTSTSGTAPPVSSTTPTTAPTSSDIAAPSAVSPALAPWDPRACAAGATATAPVPNRT